MKMQFFVFSTNENNIQRIVNFSKYVQRQRENVVFVAKKGNTREYIESETILAITEQTLKKMRGEFSNVKHI